MFKIVKDNNVEYFENDFETETDAELFLSVYLHEKVYNDLIFYDIEPESIDDLKKEYKIVEVG